MRINSISDFRAAVRQGSHAWPGGYPLRFICADGEPLCCDCAKTERRQVLEAILDRRISDQWRVEALEIHYEGEAQRCCHCGTPIESAYGDAS